MHIKNMGLIKSVVGERHILEVQTDIKLQIMDEFQILRCLWKSLDKMLQSFVLEFSKTKIKLKKDCLKFLNVMFANFGRNLALFRDKI